VDARDKPAYDGKVVVSLLAARHCHGKPQEIKPEQLGRLA
jgi:hypothetical protein